MDSIARRHYQTASTLYLLYVALHILTNAILLYLYPGSHAGFQVYTSALLVFAVKALFGGLVARGMRAGNIQAKGFYVLLLAYSIYVFACDLPALLAGTGLGLSIDGLNMLLLLSVGVYLFLPHFTRSSAVVASEPKA